MLENTLNLTIMILTEEAYKRLKKEKSKSDLLKSDSYLCLGEIKNMPGHIALADRTGKVYWGYHAYDFAELTEENEEVLLDRIKSRSVEKKSKKIIKIT